MTGPLTPAATLDAIADVIRAFFGCPQLRVTRETTSLDVDGWDSLSHTVLLLKIESAFGLRLPLDRVASLTNVGELADLVDQLAPRDRTSPDAAAAAVAHDRQYVLLHGNCQMGFVRNLLQPLVQAHGYEAVHVQSFADPLVGSIPAPDARHVAQCAVFVEQVSPWAQSRPTYQADLPAGCRRLRLPALALKSLWPLHQHDPRNTATPEHPYGKYPYGDQLVLRLLRESTDPDVVFRRYMETDLTNMVDLDRLHEMALAETTAADKIADVPLTPILEQNFRTARLFDTLNHPAHDLQMLLRDVVAEFVLEGAGTLPPVPAYPLEQIPLHPQVIAHYRLEWTSPAATSIYHGRHLTFEQYLRAYIRFE